MAIFTLTGAAIAGTAATAATTAAATTAATAGISAATLGSIAAGVGAAGSLYSQSQAAKVQKQAARVANTIEKRKQLAAIRKAQRINEFMGQATGTTGASSNVAKAAAISSSGAQTIGQMGQEVAAANRVSQWNNLTSGFGVLGQVGQTLMSMPPKQTNPNLFTA